MNDCCSWKYSAFFVASLITVAIAFFTSGCIFVKS